MLTISFKRPTFAPDDALALAHKRYGLDGSVSELPSERDQNFLIVAAAGERFVLKIAQANEQRPILELQHRALERLAERAPGLAVPRVVRATDGSDLFAVMLPNGAEHFVRLFAWVPGRVLAETTPHPSALLRSLGAMLGTLDRGLEGFAHPAAIRDLKWDLVRAPWAREYLAHVADPRRRAIVERHLDRFDAEVTPALPGLRRGVIHNDANDWNVVVGGGDLFDRRVTGVLDFGDMVDTLVVCEVAVACAYAMQGKRDPLAAAADVVSGYHETYPLAEAELAVLFPLICARLSISVVNAAYQRLTAADNAYLTISEAPAWETLERLESVHPRLAHYTLRAAAGLEPCPASPAVVAWLMRNREAIGPLLEADGADRMEVLDLSVGSPLVTNPAELDDVEAFTRKLFDRLRAAGAGVGIGRYDEARLLYTSEAFHAEGNDRPVPRTVHIGLDLFVEPGTPVLAPLGGVVESARDNAGDRDYGPTVILRHDAGGIPFWTLCGHLSRESLAALRPGAAIARGARVGTVGDSAVNGGWPPHLHYQLITDLLDRPGEFPGVARPDQRGVWQSLSPDPGVVARLRAGVLPAPARRRDAILAARVRHVGPSLSVSYRRPLTIVRGWMQHLYDDDALPYLDAANNVAHVGHSHPRVVRAAQEQLAVLNTNTRYLHERLVEYAERLTETLPAPLRVCYFVNSGSEANELALRLARARTGRRGMVVIDVGYHGNTGALVDVSPYKHDGPGGGGPPPWVRKIPMPDGYRGEWRRDEPEAGPRYAAAVTDAVAALAGAGEGVAGFLAESVLSCGGQIVLPDGFLAEAYRLAREAGGVTIADEVQVGFGRVGTHVWAFETQGVVPDIVTMGKPIGNGHPLGAVVTTPEIAAAFANGMEFFNTFGGNPVSCAVGLAVLDVIRDEGLQANAREVGAHLLEGLHQLVARHPAAGDARGLGLFLGLELVKDRATREPAGERAAYVAERLRDAGILVGTDGPFHNVLKIKPPLCFTGHDADRLVAALDRILGEIA
jgi:4-aminobutyrate aminotransferase-like enzyme/Ser/Thr protein kinase RdoA (MazF antagonist)